MAYKRITRDMYDVEGWYNQGARYGWETVTTEESRSEACARLREYRDNEPGTAFRLRHYRERIDSVEAVTA